MRALQRILLALFAAMALAPSTAGAAQKGVEPYMTWGYTAPTDVSAEASAIAQAHVSWARLNVQWRQIETSRGVYDPTNLAVVDRAVNAVLTAGATPLMMVYNAPAWASSTTGSQQGNVPNNPADYASFMRYLATRYKGRVGAYEIWNEPDLSYFWSPAPSATAYTALLRAAYPAIKAADPAARVVFGGLSYNNATGYAFPAAAYAAGAKGYFDAMGVHTYGACNETPEHIQTYADGSIMEGSFLRYRNVRKTMLAQGDDKPIWITEFGWSTTTTVACNPAAGVYYAGVSEATQADYLTRAFRALEQDPYVQVAVWYTLRNDWMDDNTVSGRYGLLRWDYSHKPAFDALIGYNPPALGALPPPPVVDQPPTVKLTAPTAGATFRTTLGLAATATDDHVVTKVEFWIDSRRVATSTVAPYALTYAVDKKVSYATHTITAKAYDDGGHVTAASVTATRLH